MQLNQYLSPLKLNNLSLYLLKLADNSPQNPQVKVIKFEPEFS